MLYAEWSGNRVTIRRDNGITVRHIPVRHNVVGVQITGDSTTDAMVAITMDNGKTDLYRSSGAIVRHG